MPNDCQSNTMLQQSKLIKSREQWKNKAIRRGYELREQRKVHKRNQATIANLRTQISVLKAWEVVKKKM